MIYVGINRYAPAEIRSTYGYFSGMVGLACVVTFVEVLFPYFVFLDGSNSNIWERGLVNRPNSALNEIIAHSGFRRLSP